MGQHNCRRGLNGCFQNLRTHWIEFQRNYLYCDWLSRDVFMDLFTSAMVYLGLRVWPFLWPFKCFIAICFSTIFRQVLILATFVTRLVSAASFLIMTKKTSPDIELDVNVRWFGGASVLVGKLKASANFQTLPADAWVVVHTVMSYSNKVFLPTWSLVGKERLTKVFDVGICDVTAVTPPRDALCKFPKFASHWRRRATCFFSPPIPF